MFSAVPASTFPAAACDHVCAASGTSGDCCGRSSCEFSARRDLLSAGSSHRVCDASSGGHYIALALRIRSASASARGRGTCTCEEVRGTCTSSDLRDARAAVPCRIHHGRRHDRRKPGRHGLGEFNSSLSRLLRCRDTRMPCTYCARWIHSSLLLHVRRLHSRWLDPCHFWRSSVVCTSESQVRREQVVAGGTSKNIVEIQQSNNAGASGYTIKS